MDRQRPSFFVEKPDNSWRRNHLFIIPGSGELQEGKSEIVNLKKLQVLSRFIDENFGSPPGLINYNVSPENLADQFSEYLKEETRDAIDFEKHLIEDLSFSDLISYSRNCITIAKNAVISSPSCSRVQRNALEMAIYYGNVTRVLMEAEKIVSGRQIESEPANVIKVDWRNHAPDNHNMDPEPAA